MARLSNPAARRNTSRRSTPPASKRAITKDTTVPVVEDVARVLGIELNPDSADLDLKSLRRPLPGYVGIVDLCVQHLADEEVHGSFAVRGVTVTELEELSRKQKRLAALEALTTTLHRSVMVDRALVDDHTMGLMRKIARSVRAEESSALELRWKFLLDYMGQFAGGRSARAGKSEAPAPAEEAAKPAETIIPG
jgi:hypothetical protein